MKLEEGSGGARLTLAMGKPVVFVTAASGRIGLASVQALSAKYADRVEIRAGVRNPDKADKLKALAGVTVVQAEMGSKDRLVGTFCGVDALFIVMPGVENRVELAISTAEAAKEAGVKFTLVVSLPTVELSDTVFGKQFTEIEYKISELGVPYTFLRLPLFVENYFAFKDSIVRQSSIYLPVDPAKSFTSVVVADAGKAAAAILANYHSHTNKTYTIVSDCHPFSDVAAAFSKVLGKEIKYIRLSYVEAKQSFMGSGYPKWKVDGILEIYELIDSGSPIMNTDLRQQYEKLTGEKPTDLMTWVSQVAGAFKA